MNRPEWINRNATPRAAESPKTIFTVIGDLENCAQRYHKGEGLDLHTTGHLLDVFAAELKALVPISPTSFDQHKRLRMKAAKLHLKTALLDLIGATFDEKALAEMDYDDGVRQFGSTPEYAVWCAWKIVCELLNEAEPPTIIPASDLPDGVSCTPTPAEALRKLVDDVEHLMSQSDGVFGFWSDGGNEEWESFTSGGLCGWLGDALETARRALDGERPVKSTQRPIDGDGGFVLAKSADPSKASPGALQAAPSHKGLARVLTLALDQAQSGKGRERHSDDKPFNDQPIMNIARTLNSMDGHAYQIMKKAQEATRMAKRGQHGPASTELLGVIVYAAAAVLFIDEQRARTALDRTAE